jgi:predicted kinase
MIYGAMGNMMSKALFLKNPVVLDATFYRESLRNKFEEIAAEFGETIIYIEVSAPEHLIEERLQKPRLVSEADHAVYLKLKETYDPLKKDHLILVSSNENISEMLSKAADYIHRSNEQRQVKSYSVQEDPHRSLTASWLKPIFLRHPGKFLVYKFKKSNILSLIFQP